jgi:hypothetical protein
MEAIEGLVIYGVVTGLACGLLAVLVLLLSRQEHIARSDSGTSSAVALNGRTS